MSKIWEKAIQEWYTKSHTSKLEYLDLAETKPSNKEIAHNLAVVYDRTCLSSRVHLKNFKEILEKQEKLEKEVHKLHKEIVTLNKVVIENRPLTKTEVVDLVKEIAKQPKLIEAEALRLTEDLNNKLNRVEEILRKVERWLAA